MLKAYFKVLPQNSLQNLREIMENLKWDVSLGLIIILCHFDRNMDSSADKTLYICIKYKLLKLRFLFWEGGYRFQPLEMLLLPIINNIHTLQKNYIL
jgi:hypothetical protein